MHQLPSPRSCTHMHAPHAPRPWTTFLPLGLVLGVAMIKEAVEDYKRYRQDVEVNNRSVEVRPVQGFGGSRCNWRRHAGMHGGGWRAW